MLFNLYIFFYYKINCFLDFIWGKKNVFMTFFLFIGYWNIIVFILKISFSLDGFTGK